LKALAVNLSRSFNRLEFYDTLIGSTTLAVSLVVKGMISFATGFTVHAKFSAGKSNSQLLKKER